MRIRSKLEEIPGIDRIRQKELLKFFGSIEKVNEASIEKLIGVPKMNQKSSQIVHDFFHPN